MTEHEDGQFKKIILKDSSTSVNKCNEVIKWLDTNQLAEVEEFQQKQKENKMKILSLPLFLSRIKRIQNIVFICSFSMIIWGDETGDNEKVKFKLPTDDNSHSQIVLILSWQHSQQSMQQGSSNCVDPYHVNILSSQCNKAVQQL